MGMAHSVRGADAEIHPYKVPQQLHLGSAHNAGMGVKWCLHQILKFISNDCRGEGEAGYIQPDLPMDEHTGTVSSLVLEPGCYMSQEHHKHQLVSDHFMSAHCRLAPRHRTLG